jgi:MFS family permease
MGFGGGALIASPWSSRMLATFGSDASGIATAFAVHGIAYAALMALGVVIVRVPADDWKPASLDGAASTRRAALSMVNVSAKNAIRTPQFWLLWTVLCLNVTAGIGILEKAAPMITDFFAGTSSAVTASTAAGFVALLSAANMLGRIAWSSTSDVIGRKNVYRLYLGVGAAMYLTIALFGESSRAIFIVAALVIISFYGGGFATVPAYLRDLFGTYQVGAIHGRLLTAWSLAGILGPLIVNAIADAGKDEGATGAALYRTSFFVMIGLLAVGFLANELIRPVAERHREPDAAKSRTRTAEEQAEEQAGRATPTSGSAPARMAFAWGVVGLPFAYGMYELFAKVLKLLG